jgi:23S rRNA pseudouridine1911/1915/1917 synthase
VPEVKRNLPHWTVAEADRDTRLDKFLADAERLGSRSRVGTALGRGKIFVNDAEMEPTDASLRLKPGDVVRLWMDRPGSATRRTGAFKSGDLEILYEDDLILVVNKPPGLLTVPLDHREEAQSVYSQLEHHLRSHARRRPFVVHRIDRDTSGLVLFAKTARAQSALKDQFRRREPERVYLALVYGHPEPVAGTWRDTLTWDDRAMIQKATHPADPRGTEAVCEYKVLDVFEDTSLIEVRLHTGKRNQIRIQARLRGHTLVGERRYVYGPDEIRPIDFPRQALHAHRLAFRHPSDGRPLRFEAPLPADLGDLLSRLKSAPGSQW